MLEVVERLTAYAYCWDVSKNTGFDLASLVKILNGERDHSAGSELYTHINVCMAMIILKIFKNFI